MKKKNKIIIIVSTLAIIAILIAIALYFYYVRYETYVGTIESISDNNITISERNVMHYTISKERAVLYDSNITPIDISAIKVGDSVYISRGIEEKLENCIVSEISENQITLDISSPIFYLFSVKDSVIKDANGKQINVSDLQVGDVISITNKRILTDFYYDISISYNDGYNLYSAYNLPNVTRLIRKSEVSKSGSIQIREMKNNLINFITDIPITNKSNYKIYTRATGYYEQPVPQETNYPGISMVTKDNYILKPYDRWQELNKKSNIWTYNLNENGNIEYNWLTMYGELDEGEYEFVQYCNDEKNTTIKIKFKIDTYGNITYDEPIIKGVIR